jgi:hypothetical protein
LLSFWNWVDGTIAIFGLISVCVPETDDEGSADLKALRAFRVIRPLRVISSMPTLQTVLGALVHALPRLSHVASLLGFILLIAAITGLEFYRDLDTTLDSNPSGDVVNFRDAGHSFLTVFTVVTLEGWSDMMDWVNTAQPHWANWLYFIALVVLGAFIATNLTLGVLSGHFTAVVSLTLPLPLPLPITLHTPLAHTPTYNLAYFIPTLLSICLVPCLPSNKDVNTYSM